MDKLIIDDLNLPNHNNHLSKAEEVIEKLRNELKQHQYKNKIKIQEYAKLFDDTLRILDYVGGLSTLAFNIEDKLKDMYYLKFKSTPELAKKLWLDHFELIHKPYNILKNRCFKILEELDELYIQSTNKYPPNWSKEDCTVTVDIETETIT